MSKEHEDTDLSPEEEEPDGVYFAPPEMKIHVVAQDLLELTVSKSCLDVLTNLGQVWKIFCWMQVNMDSVNQISFPSCLIYVHLKTRSKYNLFTMFLLLISKLL